MKFPIAVKSLDSNSNSDFLTSDCQHLISSFSSQCGQFGPNLKKSHEGCSDILVLTRMGQM